MHLSTRGRARARDQTRWREIRFARRREESEASVRVCMQRMGSVRASHEFRRVSWFIDPTIETFSPKLFVQCRKVLLFWIIAFQYEKCCVRYNKV